MHSADVRPNPPVTAEDWVVRLQSPACDARDHADFEAWLGAAPGHPADYARAEHLHGLAAMLATDPGLRRDAVRARQMLRARRPAWRRPWALATAAALALAGVLGYQALTSPAEAPTAQLALQTAPGEQVTSTLDDGSRVVLDTDSAVDVVFERDVRLVTLQRGRVHIVAARDPARPMRVRAGRGEVRVVGTTFQVRRLDGAVDVALLEGHVTVQADAAMGADAGAHTLVAGQRVTYHEDGRIDPVSPLVADETASWLEGRLVFSDWPLDVLVAEANRYSSVRLVLDDPALAGLRVSGQVRAGDQAGLAAALETGWGLHADRRDDETILLSRR